MTGHPRPESLNRYAQIIENIFFFYYREGARDILFERRDIERAAEELGIRLPRNIGDVIYSFRYRVTLPESVRARPPKGEEWIIRPAGRSRFPQLRRVQLARIRKDPPDLDTKLEHITAE
jgi:hypothetical protein